MKQEKQELSNLFKDFQNKIKKESTYLEGIELFFKFRKEMERIYDYIFLNCDDEDYSIQKIKTLKTIGYYIYHLARIEDITCNTLIANKEQVFFKKNYQEKLGSIIITTGNELKEDEWVNFSALLNKKELINYSKEVFNNTNEVIKNIDYKQSKTKVSEINKNKLISLNCVSNDENAYWLIDYWCEKDYQGLMKMPFTRHIFLHLENSLRIFERIKKVTQ